MDFVWHIKCIDILPIALEIAGNNYYQSWKNHVAHRVAISDLNTEKVKQHSENAYFFTLIMAEQRNNSHLRPCFSMRDQK